MQRSTHRRLSTLHTRAVGTLACLTLTALVGACASETASVTDDVHDVTSQPDVRDLRSNAQALELGNETCAPLDQVDAYFAFEDTNAILSDVNFVPGTNSGVTLGGTGKHGYGADFDGSASFSIPPIVPSWVFEAGGGLSLGFFVRIDTLPTTTASLVEARLGDSTERGWSLELTSTGRLRWTSTYDAASDDAFVLETTQGLPTGMVFHVAFTMDTTSSAAHFWVNGESIAFTETPGTGATGTFPGNNNPHPGSIDLVVGAGYDGILDELLIASYALSPVEVANLVDGSTSTNVLACGACGARCGTGSVCESGECVVRSCGTSFRHAWSFDEGTGAVAGNSAWREAWVGIAEWTSVSAPSTPGDGPPAGSAAHFSAETAGAVFSDPTGTHDGNIAAWVRPNAAASGPRVILGNMDGGVGWELRLTAGHGLAFEVRVDGSNKLLVEGPVSDVPVSTWSHVAVTYDGTGTAAGVRLFVNGAQLTTSDTVSGTPTGHLSFDDVRLGGTDTGVGFDGDIDELLVMDPAVGSGGIAHLAVAEQHACVPSAALDCDAGGATVASCDGRSFSGCESDLSNDDYNCGTCGRVCSTCVDSVCTSVVEICDNSTDDDSDGLVDCEDSACFTSPLCIDWEAHCDDGRDNDGNGFTDCDDVQCQGVGDCPSASETNCLDGVDDDGDGALDCLDSDCKNAFGCPVDPNPELCGQRGDENGNGLADCADPACSSYWICESGAETECDDYVDNDGDGFTDCADADCNAESHCITGEIENCSNYQDDGLMKNGAIDCADADCEGDPACLNTSATAVSGEPCTSAASCLTVNDGAPVCIPESFGGVPGGHCSQWCSLQGTSGCPSGQQCVQLNPDWEQQGVCVDRCLDGDDCAAYTDDRQCRRLGVGDEAYLVCRRQCDVNGDCTSTGLCDPDFQTCRSPFEICDDGVDNDGNGDDDCDDEACWGTTHCHYPDESAFCQDGYDNDDDGYTDCADSDCDYAWSCTGAHYETWCGDGVDNDGDGYTDCADDECDTDPLCPGCGSTVDCGDPGCATHPACDVTDESECYTGDCCDNSTDDDGDTLIDCEDPDCMGLDPACPWQEWSCTDGIDNDGDQLMDCLDSECASDPACVSGSGAMLAWCDSHNECDGGDGVPYCMPLGAGSGLDGQCLHSCDLSDSSTCETGFDCVDLGLPGDVGMCMPGCLDASDCVGTEQCEPLQEFSFGVCVPGCTTDADCPWGGICDTNSGACGPPPPATEDDCWWANDCCADGIDHDIDGDINCEDSDCAGVGACPTEICWNGTDDDSDGAPDCFDSDCYDRGYCDGTDDGELAVGEACTRTDQCTGEFGTPFCSDLGVFVDGHCVAYCDSEASPSEQCGGNADLQCVPIMAGEDPPHMCVPVEDCTDTVDNDLDGDTDCADAGCLWHVACAVCGDGFVSDGEECDDGNTTSDDGCDNTCTLETCGDGIIQLGVGEDCDDGNTLDGDGCSAACLAEFCGDGIVQPGESCDDGNQSNADECTSTCSFPACGDGWTQVTEECDDAGMNSDHTPDACRQDCTLPSCGDGVVDSGEDCDDGNLESGDGCPRTCRQEDCTTPGDEDGDGYPDCLDAACSASCADQGVDVRTLRLSLEATSAGPAGLHEEIALPNAVSAGLHISRFEPGECSGVRVIGDSGADFSLAGAVLEGRFTPLLDVSKSEELHLIAEPLGCVGARIFVDSAVVLSPQTPSSEVEIPVPYDPPPRVFMSNVDIVVDIEQPGAISLAATYVLSESQLENCQYTVLATSPSQSESYALSHEETTIEVSGATAELRLAGGCLVPLPVPEPLVSAFVPLLSEVPEQAVHLELVEFNGGALRIDGGWDDLPQSPSSSVEWESTSGAIEFRSLKVRTHACADPEELADLISDEICAPNVGLVRGHSGVIAVATEPSGLRRTYATTDAVRVVAAAGDGLTALPTSQPCASEAVTRLCVRDTVGAWVPSAACDSTGVDVHTDADHDLLPDFVEQCLFGTDVPDVGDLSPNGPAGPRDTDGDGYSDGWEVCGSEEVPRQWFDGGPHCRDVLLAGWVFDKGIDATDPSNATLLRRLVGTLRREQERIYVEEISSGRLVPASMTWSEVPQRVRGFYSTLTGDCADAECRFSRQRQGSYVTQPHVGTLCAPEDVPVERRVAGCDDPPGEYTNEPISFRPVIRTYVDPDDSVDGCECVAPGVDATPSSLRAPCDVDAVAVDSTHTTSLEDPSCPIDDVCTQEQLQHQNNPAGDLSECEFVSEQDYVNAATPARLHGLPMSSLVVRVLDVRRQVTETGRAREWRSPGFGGGTKVPFAASPAYIKVGGRWDMYTIYHELGHVLGLEHNGVAIRADDGTPTRVSVMQADGRRNALYDSAMSYGRHEVLSTAQYPTFSSGRRTLEEPEIASESGLTPVSTDALGSVRGGALSAAFSSEGWRVQPNDDGTCPLGYLPPSLSHNPNATSVEAMPQLAGPGVYVAGDGCGPGYDPECCYWVEDGFDLNLDGVLDSTLSWLDPVTLETRTGWDVDGDCLYLSEQWWLRNFGECGAGQGRQAERHDIVVPGEFCIEGHAAVTESLLCDDDDDCSVFDTCVGSPAGDSPWRAASGRGRCMSLGRRAALVASSEYSYAITDIDGEFACTTIRGPEGAEIKTVWLPVTWHWAEPGLDTPDMDAVRMPVIPHALCGWDFCDDGWPKSLAADEVPVQWASSTSGNECSL